MAATWPLGVTDPGFLNGAQPEVAVMAGADAPQREHILGITPCLGQVFCR